MEEAELKFNQTDSLPEIGSKLKRATASGRTAPLAIAGDVMRLGEQWDEHKEEAGGISCTTWLTNWSGQNYAWWALRSEAVQKLGKWAARQVDHQVAVYVSRNVSEKDFQQVGFMLRQECKQHGGIPLTHAAALPKINKLLRRRSEHRECVSCKELRVEVSQLRKVLKEHGISAE